MCWLIYSSLGGALLALPELARLALITASVEGMLNHARLREVSTDHPADITKMLASLVRDGLLVTQGNGRGMVYFLPWQNQTAALLFESADTIPSSEHVLRPELGGLTPELSDLTPELSRLPPELSAGA